MKETYKGHSVTWERRKDTGETVFVFTRPCGCDLVDGITMEELDKELVGMLHGGKANGKDKERIYASERLVQQSLTSCDTCKPSPTSRRLEVIDEVTGIPEGAVLLNLGSGQNPIPGSINVDKYGDPDVKHDLEVFPWPFEDDSVDAVLMRHCLEHLGQATDVYLKIWQELYRILKHAGTVRIEVPHPRHDDFMNDPTHVRAVTPQALQLFNKELNRAWGEQGFANSPLGLYLDIDFRIIDCQYVPTEYFIQKWAGVEDRAQLEEIMHREASIQNNIVKQINVTVQAVKGELAEEVGH